jgi:hypothetical protein
MLSIIKEKTQDKASIETVRNYIILPAVISYLSVFNRYACWICHFGVLLGPKSDRA